MAELLALRGEAMPDGASRPRDALDEAALDHPTGERAERLVALKRQESQVVEGRPRVVVEMPERIPLHEAHPEWGQPGVERAVVTHLQALDGEPGGLDRSAHIPILRFLNVLVSAWLYHCPFLSVL